MSTRYTPEQARLMRERREIVLELAHLAEVIQCEVDLEPDEGDQQITERETAAILVGILEHKLHNIDKALASIEMGQYNVCERCNQQIEAARLAAKPDTRFCITCQEVVERIVHLDQLSGVTLPRDVFAEWQT